MFLAFSSALRVGMGFDEEGESEEREKVKEDIFVMGEPKHVVKTEAGNMKVFKGFRGKISERPMHIGFITMEPKSLFIPQYMDSTLILFIRRGEAKIGSIHKGRFVEQRLKVGDVYKISSGTTFYIVNTGEGQRLHIICSIDPSESVGFGPLQSFFIGGGTYPRSILAGFDPQTLTAAFNVSSEELRVVMTRQESGPIVFVPDAHSPSMWSKFVQLKSQDKLGYFRKMIRYHERSVFNQEEEEESKMTWRKLFYSLMGKEKSRKAPKAYNLYDRKPDFQNNYGWSTALDESDYSPLSTPDFGIYLVHLKAGSMMAPHINPSATEYGIVLSGSGSIEVVFPNGSSGMNAQVKEGDVFWIPRYFAFCQIASRTGPFEFFGFTTSARKNKPQFLVGASSILKTMGGPEFATSLGVSEERFRRIVDAQRESIILPSASAAPPDDHREVEEELVVVKNVRAPKVIKGLNDVVMGSE